MEKVLAYFMLRSPNTNRDIKTPQIVDFELIREEPWYRGSKEPSW